MAGADDDPMRIRNEALIDKRLTGEQRQIDVVVGPHAGAGWRLDRYLAAALPTLSRSLIKRWLEHGWALVDGQRAKASHRVRAHERIELRCPLPPQDPESHREPPPLELLLDADGMLICNKACGVLAHQAGRVLRGTLLNQLQELVAARGGDPAAVRLVNRIDRDTSGILLATADEDVHRTLSLSLQSGTFAKEYRAICHGVPEPRHGHWRDPIRDDPTGRSIARQCHPGGQASDTEYEVLATSPRYALLRVLLHSGRQHQIRVHAAHHGHPLVGDWVYGAPCRELPGQALHAARLRFPHPLDPAREVDISAPMPTPLAELWKRLAAGAQATPRALDASERRRLSASTDDEDEDQLPPGWRRPSWLDSEELRRLQEETD